MQPRFFSFLTCLLFIFSLSSGVTYAQKDPVEVVQVKFDNKAGAYDDTLMNVEIGAMGNPTPDESPNEKYVDNITVTLTIGYAHPSKQGEFIFHKSSVEIATMEVGESRQIGFWLPYDIAVRDNLREEPQFWYVDLEVDGQEVKPTSSNMRKRASGDLQNPQALQSFQSRSGDASEGILLPGYLSGNGYLERGNERPPFIRKEEK